MEFVSALCEFFNLNASLLLLNSTFHQVLQFELIIDVSKMTARLINGTNIIFSCMIKEVKHVHNNHNKRIVEPKFCPFSGQISFSGRFPRYDRFTILYKRPVVLSGVTNTMYNINNFRNKSSLTKLMKAILNNPVKKKKKKPYS